MSGPAQETVREANQRIIIITVAFVMLSLSIAGVHVIRQAMGWCLYVLGSQIWVAEGPLC